MPEIKYQSREVPTPSISGPRQFDYPTPPRSPLAFGTEATTFSILQGAVESLTQSAKVFYEADQANKLANAKMGASEDLYNFEQSLVNRTDHDKWLPELQQMEASIKEKWSKGLSAGSKRDFNLFFQSAYQQTGMKTTVTSFKRTKEQVEADYIRRRAFRISQYGGADDDKRAFLVNQQEEDIGVMGKYMGEDWVAKESVDFRIDGETSAMMQDAYDSPETFNAYDMTRYTMVEANTRARIQQSAETRRIALQNKEIRDEDRLQRQEEHDLKMRRQDYFRNLYSEYFLGKDITGLLKEGVTSRLLDPDDLKSIWQIKRDGITDRAYEAQLVRRMILSRGDLESITYEIVHASNLSGPDKVALLKSASTYYSSNDISKNIHYKTAAEDIEKSLTTTAPGGSSFAEGENANIRAALEEFDRRVRGGESIIGVRNDVMQQYRPITYRELRVPPGMRPPIYGSITNLKHARDETMKAMKRGDFINEESFRIELENIGRLQQYQETIKRKAQEGNK